MNPFVDRIFPVALLALGLSLSVSAALITEPTRTFAVGYDLPDIQNPPVSFLQTIADSAIVSLTRVDVSLTLVGRASGGFASEMFVSLSQNLSLTSILINQVGVSNTDSLGQGYGGWNVTLSDLAPSDLHAALLSTGTLSGTYQPDGRVAPEDINRPAMLALFNGGSGNGDWRLSVADLEAGGTMRLVSWGLTLTGENTTAAVPEASTWAAGLGLAAVVGAGWWRARQRVGGRPSADGTPGSECKIMS